MKRVMKFIPLKSVLLVAVICLSFEGAAVAVEQEGKNIWVGKGTPVANDHGHGPEV